MPGQSKSKSTPQMGRAAAAAAAADRERAAAAAADRERAAAEAAAGRAGRLQRAEAEKTAAATAAAATAAAATAAEKAAVTKRPQSPKPAASLFVRTPTKSNRAKLERRLQATATSATRAAKRKAVEEGSKATEAHRKKTKNQQAQEQRQAERKKLKHEEQLARHAEKSLSIVKSRRIDPQEIPRYNGRRLRGDGSNLNLYNIISESTVDWHDKINNAKLHGNTLISSITSWSRENGYNQMSLARFGPRKEDLVIDFGDFHFTFHSTPITEGERQGKGAFHVERNNNRDLMARYFTKDYNPIKFIKSPLRLRKVKTTDSELKFIDGVYDIINQYEIYGTQKHADTEEVARTEDLRRETAEQARLAKNEAGRAAARARAAASKAKHKKGGTRKNRKSNGKTRKLRK